MWIKICGMTSEQAVETCIEERVDAIGFVFAPSVRRLEPLQAARLAAPARGRVRCVAVTLHPSQPLIEQILQQFDPDILQTDLEDLAQLRLPASLSVLPVLRAGAAGDRTAAQRISPQQALPTRLLFEGAHSGTGLAADWSAAASLAARTQLVLAGGLNALNIAAAIAAVRPFGVDVSSGVESEPGRKSPHKIVQFIQAARAAATAVSA